MMELTAQLTLSLEEQLYANPRRMHLLACIVETGSLSRGAKRAGMSYKAAWDAVNDMNSRADQAVLTLAVGGKGGGGAQLTPFGERLVKLYQMLTDIQNRALKALQDESVSLDSLLAAVSLFSPQSSARNQLLGRISDIATDQINDLVTIDVGLEESGICLVAEITHRSRMRLGLHDGSEVLALIKAPAIGLQAQAGGNALAATVVSVTGTEHEQEVMLRIDETELCAVDTQGSAVWQVGQTVYASIDPKQIVLAALSE
ncbi:LysR family transcriptional regulator [Amphritea opalescens]|uniref:LysR family transcriptional regulator n=1 Tax=Amphritea opalescens TaxID=2490544 RepID=A0A430KS92_9GAMM|nr:TOBE domain-containing protein [Amphritea opalescens]RTE66372.1 LysR family transcriptional regulator [Amphritea opalescens]